MTDAQQPQTSSEQLARAERARQGRLRSPWQMTVEQRVAAMRRGELTLEQLAAWNARHLDQVPKLNGEFEWIAARTPEACVVGTTTRHRELPRSFAYEQTEIPPGITLAQWRRGQQRPQPSRPRALAWWRSLRARPR
jgi:hypothetical protein